jgi:hypothetical protein
MKVHRLERPSSSWYRSGARPAWGMSSIFVAGCALFMLFLIMETVARSAGPVRKPSAQAVEDAPARSYAPIGDSGYRVPIPEFRMKRRPVLRSHRGFRIPRAHT